MSNLKQTRNMDKRNVTVVSTRANKPVVFQSTASTWGALQKELSKQEIDFSNMGALLKNTRANLILDDAKLPEGAITIFLLAKKMKSGITKKKAAKKTTARKPAAKKATAKKAKAPAKKAPAKKAAAKKPAAKAMSKKDQALVDEAKALEHKLKNSM